MSLDGSPPLLTPQAAPRDREWQHMKVERKAVLNGLITCVTRSFGQLHEKEDELV